MYQGYKDLEIWRDSIEIVMLVYRLTDKFPSAERFGLTSQMRRASVSIPSNIAEGWARNNDKVFLQFLKIANASAAELETQLIISAKLKFTSEAESRESEKELISLKKRIRSFAGHLQEKIKEEEEKNKENSKAKASAPSNHSRSAKH